MIRYLEAEGGKPFRLFYLTRAASGTAFCDEIAAPASPVRMPSWSTTTKATRKGL
ncbi:hypothetical protein ACFQU7_39200 [Pseudoroseomonas wenyumeiae]